MSNYFENFPTIVYNGTPIRNITLRVDILDNVRDDPYAFLPYTVSDGESAEEIANLYYGDARLSWLVFLSNDIVDPQGQWPMSFEDFEATLARKYEAQAKTAMNMSYMNDLQIVNWTRDNTRTDNIVYYEYTGTDESGINERINRDTYLYNNDIIQGDYVAIRIYDDEMNKNEENRNITLLNKQYVDKVKANLKDLLNG